MVSIRGSRRSRSARTRSPEDIRHLRTLQQGIDLQRAGKFKEAEYCYQLVLRTDPDHPDANNLMGTLAIEADAIAIAIGYFEKALRRRPKDPAFRNNLGNAYLLAQDPTNAIPHLRRAVGARGNFIEAIINLARAYREMGRATLARETFEKAIKVDPHHPSALIGYGEVLTDLGEMEAATRTLREAIKRNVSVVMALQNLAVAHRFTPDDPELGLIEQILRDPAVDEEKRVSLHHTAGKILGDLKRYDESFEHFRQAKEIAGAHFHIGRHRRTYDTIISVFTPAFFAERAGFGVQSERPVFIVGMPRSGTTLTEQIAASHPQVHGAGELTDLRHLIEATSDGSIVDEPFAREMREMTAERSRELAERYLAVLKRHSRSAARVTDKLPHNFELLGFIALLFPKARFVHCRRDPIDTCVSCFTHQFSDFHGYNASLPKLGRYYREYVRLMDHWSAVLPSPIFQNRYEDMTSDQEGQTRKLIDFLGLEWDERCLAFYETERLVQTPSRWQVRQPIYRSSVRNWTKYAGHLGPLIEALGDLVPEEDRTAVST